MCIIRKLYDLKYEVLKNIFHEIGIESLFNMQMLNALKFLLFYDFISDVLNFDKN